jgi:hypothetical protein
MPDGQRPDNRSSAGPPSEVLRASVGCPECGAILPRAQLAAHLRQAHRVYQFAGERRSLEDTLIALLVSLCSPRPDPEAWATLEAIAREQYPGRAEAFLASSVSRALGRVSTPSRNAVLAAVADRMAAGPAGPGLLPHLASDTDLTARHLALLLTARLAAPPKADPAPALLPALQDRRLPGDAQVAAAAALLRTTGKDGPAAEEVYEALVDGLRKGAAADRLRRLEEQVGPSPSLERICSRFEDRMRMSCPRCGTELRRRQMIRHLWDEHQLLLDGRRVREPWQLMEEWVEGYKRKTDPEALDRCRILAQRIDPDDGPFRVQRLFLARGIDDPDGRKALLGEADERRASLCPSCFAFVPVPEEVPVRPANVWHGRLSLNGYRVEVPEKGWLARLEVDAPSGRVYRGREPGRLLTRKGALFVLAGPFVVAALLMAVGLSPFPPPQVVPVVVSLIIALVVGIFVHHSWKDVAPATDRAVDHAWARLAPRLHADGFSRPESAFAAGLALASMGRGHADVCAGPLSRMLAVTEKAAAPGAAPLEHLADLRGLEAANAAALGKDPVPLVVAQVGRCFEGRLPLAYAERLLRDRESDWWTRGNRERLRVLLLDRAFEAGFEVRNLVEAGRAAPSLGAALRTDDREGLARLRLLWSWRPRRPWEACGDCQTVFDAAAVRPPDPYLVRYRDLLFSTEITLPRALGEKEDEVEAILICGRGIVFRDAVFTAAPRKVEIVSRRQKERGKERKGFDLVVGEQRFRFRKDPDVVANRLERWFRFYFTDFLPQVPAVHGWRSPSVAASLRLRETVPCPECRRAVLTRVGQVGLSLDDEDRVG